MLKKSFGIYLLFCLGNSGCMSYLASSKANVSQETPISEMRFEIAELKHTLEAHQVDLQILEEKIASSQPVSKDSERIAKLEMELASLKKSQELMLKEVKAFEEDFAHQKERLSDLHTIKDKLQSLKSALSSAPSSTYTVKAGDTLEKIARQLKTTPYQLKSLNQLTSDTIRVGQVLKTPYETQP